jgi:eukaryotic-like serine/threonine-protein kinase
VAPTDPFGLVGQVLDGQFRVDTFVGEGGFSLVYRGTHLGLSEPIAIKCLKLPGALGSALVESFVRRFRDESRLHYKLSQGNLHIVRSIASGTMIAPTTSALVPYTVLEWLEGRSLADEFVDRRTRGLRGRPLGDVVKLLDSAVDAVAYAHAQGVVHRDLNPGNLFLAKTAAGVRLKVLDFGVAKIMTDSALAMGPTARTVGNVRMFAPAYGAPEQFDESVGSIGPWTDVYALALVALEVFTDRTVMLGEHLGELALKALDPLNRPSPRALGLAVGDHVEDVFVRALSISPAGRPQDAGELWGMLKNALTVDGASGQVPHAVKAPSEPPPPNTVRMDTPVPEDTSPVVELVRPPSNAPPAMSMSAGALAPPSRQHAGTLRMSTSPQSAAEAPAATPPAKFATATVRMVTPPPARVSMPAEREPVIPRAPLPYSPYSSPPAVAPTQTNPPPILYPSSRRGAEAPRKGGAWIVVVVVVVLCGLAAGGWLLMRPHGPAAPVAPSSSSGL